MKAYDTAKGRLFLNEIMAVCDKYGLYLCPNHDGGFEVTVRDTNKYCLMEAETDDASWGNT